MRMLRLISLLLPLVSFGQGFTPTRPFVLSSSTPFNPESLPGLQFWLKADGTNLYQQSQFDVNRHCTNNSTCGYWRSEYPSTLPFQNDDLFAWPWFVTNIQNGLPCVIFNDTNLHSTVLAPTNITVFSGPTTVFIAYKWISLTAGRYMFSYNGGLPSPGGVELFYNSTLKVGQTNIASVSIADQTNIWYTLTMVLDNPSSIRTNGVAAGGGGVSLNGYSHQILIGSDRVGANPGYFALGEMIWCITNLSGSHWITDTENYLKRWNP
jgi:hypothetical protein